MRALGYSLTWRTRCFLGCDDFIWAHTNGDGDFVLLDSLGWPWPIHACYTDGNDELEPGGIDRHWEEVTSITPDDLGKKRHSCLATVTSIFPRALGDDVQFSTLPQATQSSIRKLLEDRTSLITFVDGSNGAEFSAFIDLKKMPVKFRDIIAVDIRAVELLNKRAFVITRFQVLCQARH